MDIDEFGALPTPDKWTKASEISGLPVSVLQGLYRTESNSGDPRFMVSKAGAEGHFQLMPKTRAALEKRVGRAIDPYDVGDSLYAAALLLRENKARFGNDRDAVQAYNTGWNKGRWGATQESAEYVGKVFGDGAVRVVTPSTDDTPMPDLLAQRAEPRERPVKGRAVKQTGYGKMVREYMVGVAGPEGGAAFDEDPQGAIDRYLSVDGARRKPQTDGPAATAIEEAMLRRDFQQDVDAANKREGFWNGVADIAASTPTATLMRWSVSDDRPAEPPTPEELKNYPESSLENVLRGKNPVERARLWAAAQEQAKVDQRVADLGWAGFGGSLVAEMLDPVNIATGMGIAGLAKGAGVGAINFAARGLGGKAVASSMAEAAIGNVLVDTMIAGQTNRWDPTDLAISAAAGAGFAGVFSPLLLRAAKRARTGESGKDAETPAMGDAIEDMKAAQKVIEGGGTPEEAAAEVLRRKAARAAVTDSVSPDSAKRVTEDEQRLLKEVEEEQKALDDTEVNEDGSDIQTGPAASMSPDEAAAARQRDSFNMRDLDTQFFEARPEDIEQNFMAYRGPSEIAGMLAPGQEDEAARTLHAANAAEADGTVKVTGAEGFKGADAADLETWKGILKALFPQGVVDLRFQDIPQPKFSAGQLQGLGIQMGRVGYIALHKDVPEWRATLAHEVGHLLHYTYMHSQPASVKSALRQDLARFREDLRGGPDGKDPDAAQKAWFARWGLRNDDRHLTQLFSMYGDVGAIKKRSMGKNKYPREAQEIFAEHVYKWFMHESRKGGWLDKNYPAIGKMYRDLRTRIMAAVKKLLGPTGKILEDHNKLQLAQFRHFINGLVTDLLSGKAPEYHAPDKSYPETYTPPRPTLTPEQKADWAAERERLGKFDTPEEAWAAAEAAGADMVDGARVYQLGDDKWYWTKKDTPWWTKFKGARDPAAPADKPRYRKTEAKSIPIPNEPALAGGGSIPPAPPTPPPPVQPGSPQPPSGGGRRKLTEQEKLDRIRATYAANPTAIKHGFADWPVDTTVQRLQFRQAVKLFQKAEDPTAPWNTFNPKQMKSMLSLFGLDSIGMRALQDPSSVVRMLAYNMFEIANGGVTRHSTAALHKHVRQMFYRGDAETRYNAAYDKFSAANKGSTWDDLGPQVLRQKFNREVLAEVAARAQEGSRQHPDPHIREAADAISGQLERIHADIRNLKMAGYSDLPDSGRGWVPLVLSGDKVRALTPGQRTGLRQAYIDELVRLGLRQTDADAVSKAFVEAAMRRATGGFEGTSMMDPGSVLDHLSPGSEEYTALRKLIALGQQTGEVRLNLDLLAQRSDGQGGTFRLIDLMASDPIQHLARLSEKASGEYAFRMIGIQGEDGYFMARKAAAVNGTAKGLEALDIGAAEFMGRPMGDQAALVTDRLVQATQLARLGGLVWTQLSETLNGALTVGIGGVMRSIASVPRMIGEVRKLAKGQEVPDSILRSLEIPGGEFGTHGYHIKFPFDAGRELGYGAETPAVVDRILKSGLAAQAKWSMWRAVHAAQSRGMAEQIVLRAFRFIKSGADDAALNDIGITPDLRATLRAELGNIATFTPDGRLSSLDLTKLSDQRVANDVILAVHRGVSQIIQGTFIGERSKWVHNSVFRLLGQFRMFGLTSVEKQWARHKNVHGAMAAFGMILGTMPFAMGIHAARTAVSAAGREDFDEYIDERLAPSALARASLNYMGIVGLAGDFADALSGVAGLEMSGRGAASKGVIGGALAPAFGVVEDAARVVGSLPGGLQSSEVARAVGLLPFNKIPFLQLPMNMILH